MSAKQMMLDARELIQRRQFDDARAILEKVEHPIAHKWLAQLEQVAPARKTRTDEPNLLQSNNVRSNPHDGFFFQQQSQSAMAVASASPSALQSRKQKQSEYEKQLAKIKVEQEQSPEVTFLMGLLGGLIGAIISGIVWAGIAYTIDAEIGYAAIGVGFVTGGATLTFAGKQSFSIGIAASLASCLGIFVGKYGLFYMVMREFVPDVSPFNPLTFELFIEALSDPTIAFLSPYDMLWVVFAVVAAWRVASGLSWRSEH